MKKPPQPATAKRMHNIQPFRVMELFARARALEAAGKSIIHMEVGEPDFDTPNTIIQAGQEALAQGKTHYTPAVGLAELRLAISDHYKQHEGILAWDLHGENLMQRTGNDEIVILDPYTRKC